MWARLSLKFKLTSVVVMAVAVASWAGGRFAFVGLLDILERATGMEAQTSAEVLAGSLMGSFNLADFASGDSQATIRAFEQRVSVLVHRDRIKQVDIVRYLDENRVEYLVSLHEHPEVGPRKGMIETVTPENHLAERTMGYGAVQQPSGFYMGGWAPLVAGGKQVGLVVVSIDARDIQDAAEATQLGILGTMLAFILMSGLTAYKFSANFEKAAVTDGLMGIYNHKYFKQRLEEEVAKSHRYGQQTSLVLFDIDFFKRVNDTYGHATGDLVLKLMAKWVTEMCRNTDVVCRYGGEEIACILPHTGIAGAQEFAERLRLKISEQVVKDPEEDAEFRVTVSVGVAQWQKGMDMMAMIKGADAALYHSKNTGRNRVTLYHEELLPAPEEMASRPDRTKEKR